MKRLGTIAAVFLTVFLMAALFAGCGVTTNKAESRLGDTSYDAADGDEALKEAANGASAPSVADRKIIKYLDFEVETKSFDRLIADIGTAVGQAGGYVESSEIAGNRYGRADNRTATLKLRVPKAKESDLSDFLAKNSNVVSQAVRTDDVTERYIDTQSRIKALTLEKETLEKLLKDAGGVADTLTVYEKLTDVIAELESYQGKLNKMDDLIDYTTITVCVNEVEKETETEKQGWWARTWSAFCENLADIGSGLSAVCSFMLAALPYWLLIGVIVFAVLLIVRLCKKKRNTAGK